MKQAARILVVSNNTEVCNLIHSTIEFRGHVAICVPSSQEALRLLEHGVQPEIILFDATGSRPGKPLFTPELFEKITHEVAESGEGLTVKAFKDVYRKLLEDYFGPAFRLDDELALECLRIPHFYRAFYVYKYATGLSAAVALSQQVLATGDATRYLGFLKSGGTKFPIETLAAAGVDMATPAPVDAALALFAQRVEELEGLLAS